MSPFPSALACHFVEGRKANNDVRFNYLASCACNSPPTLVVGNEKVFKPSDWFEHPTQN